MGGEKKWEKSGKEVRRRKHRQKENQQNAESLSEIDKLSGVGGWE